MHLKAGIGVGDFCFEEILFKIFLIPLKGKQEFF